MSSYHMLKMELGECKSTFNLEKAVCNHGFFMMAPNNWIPFTKMLKRPLRLSDDTTSAVVFISHPPYHSSLLVKVLHSQFSPSLPDLHVILAQIGRMLRITERDERDVREFQKACPKAKERGFGRLFRSPNIFEDAVKCILLCNCTWSKSLQMAQALCELQFELTNTRKGKGKRKRGKNSSTPIQAEVRMGNFPTSKELASLEESYLRENYPILGYRATYILQLAKNVETGRVSLQEIEEAINKEPNDYERVYQKLSHLNGFGPYTCANVFMCIRNYQSVPVDTETIRHIQEVHGRKTCNKKTVKKQVEEIYDKYAPFQCLAYWMELLDSYEDKFGKLSELSKSSYSILSGRLTKKKNES